MAFPAERRGCRQGAAGGRFRSFWLGTCLVLSLAVLVSGCASQIPAAEQADIPRDELLDPLEPLNRVFFDINQFLDSLFLRPVSEIYRAIFPDPVRESVRNFLRNLEAPVTFANDVLQGERERANTTLTRFLINSTLGVAGLLDVAAGMGHPYHSEDFGQTLAVNGVGEGFYLVLPILGPSTLRDAAGRGVDSFLDPLTYLGIYSSDATIALFGVRGLNAVDARSRVIETLDELKRDALDYYALIRSIYFQRRQSEIFNGRKRISSPGDPASVR